MKILTNKKYKKLVKDLEELRNQCGIVADKCDMVANKLEVEKTSENMKGKHTYCSACTFSYAYKEYYGSVEHETYGCLLEIPCDGFRKRKEMDNETN